MPLIIKVVTVLSSENNIKKSYLKGEMTKRFKFQTQFKQILRSDHLHCNSSIKNEI